MLTPVVAMRSAKTDAANCRMRHGRASIPAFHGLADIIHSWPFFPFIAIHDDDEGAEVCEAPARLQVDTALVVHLVRCVHRLSRLVRV